MRLKIHHQLGFVWIFATILAFSGKSLNSIPYFIFYLANAFFFFKSNLRISFHWIFALLVAVYALHHFENLSQFPPNGTMLSGTAKILQQDEKAIRLELQSVRGTHRIYARHWPSSLKTGDSLKVKWINSDLKQNPSLGSFQLNTWLQQKGYAGFALLDSTNLLRWKAQPLPLKEKIHQSVLVKWQKFAPHSFGLINAGIFGIKKDLDEETLVHFKTTGLAHLLAISGFHMILILSVMTMIWKWFPLSPPLQKMGILLCLWLYIFLTPLSSSVLRAGLLVTWHLLSGIFHLRIQKANSLALTACLLLWIKPTEWHNPGFYLSFGAAWSLLFLYQNSTQTKKNPLPFFNYFKESFKITWVTSLGTLPALIYFFHLTNPGGFLANLFAIPIVSLILIAGLALILPLPGIPVYIGSAADLLFHILSQGVTRLAQLPYMSVSLPYFSNFEMMLLCFLLLSIPLIHLHTSTHKYWLGFFLCLLLSIYTRPLMQKALFSPTEFTLHVIDVGQGDALLLETPQGNLLIDGGGGFGKNNAARNKILPYVNRLHIPIHTFWLTHPDWDHYGGLETLLEAFPEMKIAWSHQTQHQAKESWQNWLTQSKIKANYFLYPYDVYRLGSTEIWNVSPDEKKCRNSNACSLTLLLRNGSQDILLNGDLEAPEENHLLLPKNNPIEIFKLGHHGSKHATTSAFLRSLHTQLAINSCGVKNRYGHPHPTVLQRLKANEIPLFATNERGSFMIHYKKNQIKITQWKTKEEIISLKEQILHFFGFILPKEGLF